MQLFKNISSVRKNSILFLLSLAVTTVFILIIILISALFQPHQQKPINTENLTQEELYRLRHKGSYQEVAAGMTPANPLYFLDSIGEWIKLHIFEKNTEDKLTQALLLSNEKTEEIIKIIKKQKTILFLAVAVQKHNLYISLIQNSLYKLKKENSSKLISLATKVGEYMSHQKKALEELLDKTKDHSQQALIQQTLKQISLVTQSVNKIFEEDFLKQDSTERMNREAQLNSSNQ